MTKTTLMKIITDGGACKEARNWLKQRPERGPKAAQAVLQTAVARNLMWLDYLTHYLQASKFRLPALLDNELQQARYSYSSSMFITAITAVMDHLDRRAARTRLVNRVAAAGTSKRTKVGKRKAGRAVKLVRRTAALLLPLLLLAGLATSTQAQTPAPLNPRAIAFLPSPDHNVMVDTSAAVDRYMVEWYVRGAAAPFSTTDIGKPAVTDLSAEIVIPIDTITSPFATQAYEVRVRAVGPGGEAATPPVPFGKIPAPRAAFNLRFVP